MWAAPAGRLVYLSAHGGAERLTKIILDLAGDSIGKRTITEQKSTHPWLNERAVAAIARKDAEAGTSREQQAIIDCSGVLRDEREKYIEKTR